MVIDYDASYRRTVTFTGTWTAIDPNKGMLTQLAAKKGKVRVEVEAQCAGAEDLPYPDDSFDTVTCALVLCSLPDLPAARMEREWPRAW